MSMRCERINGYEVDGVLQFDGYKVDAVFSP